MTNFLLIVLTLQCLAIISWGLIQKERMIQFPFLASCTYIGWLLPQLVGLTNNSYLPPGGLDKTIFMSILCMAAAWWGYTQNRRSARLFWWQFDYQRLIWGSATLSLLGAFFFYQVSLLAAVVTAEHGGAWTGIITIYAFFSKLLTVGMAIALILHFKKPSWPTMLILLFDLMFYLDRIIIKGRRAAMVELGLMLVMALWFSRRWLPPRWAMVTVLVLGALVINSIGDYRSTMLGEDRTTWSGAGIGEILEIDYLGNLRRLANGDAGVSDMTNAVMNIEAAEQTFSFDFGLVHWNSFVNILVPGQFVGHDVKRSLMIDFGDPAYSYFGYIQHSGSTISGISDAFMSFWYFGAVKFLLIGLIMSRWYKAAERGNIVAQMILMLTVTKSLHVITHSTHGFFTTFVQLAAFLLPVLVFSRVMQRQHPSPHAQTTSDVEFRPVR